MGSKILILNIWLVLGIMSLGFIFSSNLDWEEQYLSSCEKTNLTFGMLERTFVDIDIFLRKQLNVSMVRPHLEYAFHVWSPFRVVDISRSEKVQKEQLKYSLFSKVLII